MTAIHYARPVGAALPGEHPCLSYGDDAEQHEVAAGFVRAGLDNREKVFYLTDSAPTSVPDFLRAGGVETGPSTREGQFIVLATEAMYPPGEPLDPRVISEQVRRAARDARDEGFAGLRMAAEMGWTHRDGLDLERLVAYERAATAFTAEHGVLGLCQYDRRRLSDRDLEVIEAAHGYRVGPDPVYADGALSLTRTYAPAGLRVVGELDLSNAGALDDVLRAVAAGGGHDVHLDVSGLEFTDVAGIRVLAHAAQRLDRRDLILRGAHRRLRRVLRLTGWDELANLTIGDTHGVDIDL